MKLVEMSVGDFLGEVASSSPAPGGGSVAALAGALAAALCAMVARLTGDSLPDRERALQEASTLQDRLKDLVDEDCRAFSAVMTARRLPRSTEAERATRDRALQDAVLRSARIPLSTLEALRNLSALALRISDKGNPNCVTDAGSALQMIRAGAACAAYNVRVNLPSLRDTVVREELRAAAARLLREVLDESQRTENIVEARLELLRAGF